MLSWKKCMNIGSTNDMMEHPCYTFEPPFHLYKELERLENEMKRFFPYLGHRNCIELNRAVKSVKKIKDSIAQYEG